MRIPKERIFIKVEIEMTQKEISEKYLFLLNKFTKNNQSISRDEKKWVLSNCLCDLDLVNEKYFEKLEMFKMDKK